MAPRHGCVSAQASVGVDITAAESGSLGAGFRQRHHRYELHVGNVFLSVQRLHMVLTLDNHVKSSPCERGRQCSSKTRWWVLLLWWSQSADFPAKWKLVALERAPLPSASSTACSRLQHSAEHRFLCSAFVEIAVCDGNILLLNLKSTD